jgi:hypothetical protein
VIMNIDHSRCRQLKARGRATGVAGNEVLQLS